jgi:hypothetical protein
MSPCTRMRRDFRRSHNTRIDRINGIHRYD